MAGHGPGLGREVGMRMKLSPNRRQIMHQCFIAFGQGAVDYRVPRRTCKMLEDFLMSFTADPVEARKVIRKWGDDAYAPQVLERIHAMGRTAGLFASQDGSTKIRPEHLERAFKKVLEDSRTQVCQTGEFRFRRNVL